MNEQELFDKYAHGTGFSCTYSSHGSIIRDNDNRMIGREGYIDNTLHDFGENNKNILPIIIHHNDLDGISSAYLISKYIKEDGYTRMKPMYIPYDYKSQTIEKMLVFLSHLSDSKEYDGLLIIAVDISFTQQVITDIVLNIVSNGLRNRHYYFLWFDHHISSLSTLNTIINQKAFEKTKNELLYFNIPGYDVRVYFGYHIDTRNSACYNIFKFFGRFCVNQSINSNMNADVPALISIYDTKDVKRFPLIYKERANPLNIAFRSLGYFPPYSQFWDNLFEINIGLKKEFTPLEEFIKTGVELQEIKVLENKVIHKRDTILVRHTPFFVCKGVFGNMHQGMFDDDQEILKNNGMCIYLKYGNIQDTVVCTLVDISGTFSEVINLGNFCREYGNGGGHKGIGSFTLLNIQEFIDKYDKINKYGDSISLQSKTNNILKADKVLSRIFNTFVSILESLYANKS